MFKFNLYSYNIIKIKNILIKIIDLSLIKNIHLLFSIKKIPKMQKKKYLLIFFLFLSHRSSHSNSKTKPQDMFGRGFDTV
jgi:hypothetical protein